MNETEWILVETEQKFRLRYLVEVVKGNEQQALEDVKSNKVQLFSESDEGEVIRSHRPISIIDAMALCDKENPLGKGWGTNVKIREFFNRIVETE